MNMDTRLIMLTRTESEHSVFAGAHRSEAASEHKQTPWRKILALNHHYRGDRQSSREDSFNSGVNQSRGWLMLVTTDADPLFLGTGLLLAHCVLSPSFVGRGHGLYASISPFVRLKTSSPPSSVSLLSSQIAVGAQITGWMCRKNEMLECFYFKRIWWRLVQRSCC